MKLALAAAAATLAMAFGATAASAQTCPAVPATAPAIPDPATAKAKDMNAAAKQLDTYVKAANAYGECERKKIEAERTANPKVAQYFEGIEKVKAVENTPEVKAHLANVKSFNDTMTSAKTLVDNWNAAQAAFKAKK